MGIFCGSWNGHGSWNASCFLTAGNCLDCLLLWLPYNLQEMEWLSHSMCPSYMAAAASALWQVSHQLQGLLLGLLLSSMMATKVIIGCLCLGMDFCLIRHSGGVSSNFPLWLGGTPPMPDGFQNFNMGLLCCII